MLDGLATSKEYVARAEAQGMPAIAQTDHGNLIGSAEFYKAARAAGIDPILGCEFYFSDSFERSKEEKDAERSHITILGIGAEGYRTLSKLNQATWEQFYYKPILDRALVEKMSDAEKDSLVVMSGCAGSRLSRFLMAGDARSAREELIWWRDNFQHYYIEIMHHYTDFDRKLNRKLIALAQKYDIPLVITNDPHYSVVDDHKFHDALLAIQTASDIDDPNRFRFDGHGYYLKSAREMRATFAKRYGEDIWTEGSRSTLEIAEMCHTRIDAWEKKTWQLPKYPDVDNSRAELKRLVIKGLKRIGKYNDPEYRKQALRELKVINDVGIEDFLLITRDTIEWCRGGGAHPELGPLRVGPGRGSVAGSLVAYLIGIHKMDPIKYNLRFDRFLNPARPKMPDIDTDFSQDRRQEVFDYSIDKYGVENTMAVAAYNKMQVKSAFNSISRSFGVNYLDSQRLNKEIIEEKDDEGETRFILPEEITNRFPEMSSILHRLAGIKRGISAHPAGLIIASPETKLREQVPEMYIPSSKRWVAAYDKKTIESMGLMKQDFLGLRTLDTIAECLKLIKDRTGEDLEPDEWIPDEMPRDDEVYAMLAEGKTAGVFQMEGATNQRGCKDVKPKDFEDIVSITSLYRTGPIAAGYPEQFVNHRKIGRARIKYIHPLLKPILEPTWGVILYQEQVMEIGAVLAGFSMVQVDEIKEAIKDKSSDEMDRMRPVFIEGCKITNDISEAIATQVWDIIEGYAGYGYNRAHAVAYTFLTYQTARLKKLYPVEFTAALLRTVPNKKENIERRQLYMREAIALGAKIQPPDINISMGGATPERDRDVIRLGLEDYTGIGEKQAQKLLQGRPEGGYQHFDEVAAAVNNKGVMEKLAIGSALESIGIPGDEHATEKLLNWTFKDRMKKYRVRYQDIVKLPSDLADDDNEAVLVGMIQRITHGQTKNNTPYLTWHMRYSITESFDIRLWSETRRFWTLPEGSVVLVRGEWSRHWVNLSTGKPGDIEVIQRAPRATD